MARKRIEHWQAVVDHVNETWKKKKKVDYNFPWDGKNFADLAHQCRNYQPWGVMALWDMYLEDGDEWTAKQGYSIWAFIRQLPRLLDRPWKSRADTYAKKLLPPLPNKINELALFESQHVNGPTTKKRPRNQSRLEWLQQNPPRHIK